LQEAFKRSNTGGIGRCESIFARGMYFMASWGFIFITPAGK
jgi:hypothetical protein